MFVILHEITLSTYIRGCFSKCICLSEYSSHCLWTLIHNGLVRVGVVTSAVTYSARVLSCALAR